MSAVYIVENTANGHAYVGKSDYPEHRWRTHQADALRGDGYHLHKAMRKHGVDAFRFHLVEDGVASTEALRLEVEWIAYLRLMGVCLYNLTDGGEGVSGLRRKRSLESIEKQRRTITGRKRAPFTSEHRQNIAAGQRKKPKISEETRQKLRKAAVRQWSENPPRPRNQP